jgi:hypothetical protein
MNDDEWIPVATALAILGDAGDEWSRLSRALMLGRVRSRGVKAEDPDADPVEIPPACWAECHLDLERGWLSRRGQEQRRVPSKFAEVRLRREDVEELAKGRSERRMPAHTRRPSLAERLAVELRMLSPEKRPAMSNKELAARLKLRPGVGEFGPRTLELAISLAWPPSPKRTK